MRRCAILFSLIVALSQSVAAKSSDVRTVAATYTYYAPPSSTIDQAKQTALERAKIQAMADEFGTVVGQTTSTRIVNNGRKSDVNVFTHGVNEVRGQWIETVGEPAYDISYEQGMLIVSVTVKGRAKAIKRSRFDLQARVLRNGTEDRYESDEFRNGDDLFLGFQSPIDGYLLVYLVDHSSDEVYCLLPYGRSKEGSHRIRQDEPYMFFSTESAPSQERDTVDEYMMTCSGNPPDHNEVLLVFSPHELVKTTAERNNASLPRQLPLYRFEKWLSDIQVEDPDIQIINKPITIFK